MTDYYMPFGVAPNFQINGKLYTLPMAIEESSVLLPQRKRELLDGRGGLKTEVVSTEKIGHVHFMYEGDASPLFNEFSNALEEQLRAATKELTANMEARGVEITAITLVDKTADLDHYHQIEVCFETCDSMGANFINSNLEEMAKSLEAFRAAHQDLNEDKLEVVMRILSNYTPKCIVRASVSCPVSDL